MRVVRGFQEKDRAKVADLYWDAFGAKLGKVMGPDLKARQFIANVARNDHALCAYDGDELLGVVGFKTAKGALVGGGLRDMARVYGWFGSLWRALLLSLLERDIDNDRFLMDGIFVSSAARGRGVGTALLTAINQEALARGYSQIRLDVINTNPRARALYERCGYEPVRTERTGPLRFLFGFEESTTMVRTIG